MRVEDGEYVQVIIADKEEKVVVDRDREWTFNLNNGVAELAEVTKNGSPIYVEEVPMWLQDLLGRLGILEAEA